MAESDIALEVLIKSVLDATGYRMNEAEANKLKGTIGQLGQAATTTNEEDAKGTDKLVLKKRELMHIINALGGQAVPELGRALSILAYGGGTAAGIFALVGIFELVRHHLEAVNKAAADLINMRWEAVRQSVDEAAQSANDLSDALAKAGKPADAIKTAFEAHKALLEAQIEDHKQLLEAMEKEDLAAVKGEKNKEAAIRARYDDLKRGNDLIAEQARLDQLTLDIETRKGHQFELNDVAYAAREAVKSAETDPALLAAQAALKDKSGQPLSRADLYSDVHGDSLNRGAIEDLHQANEIIRQLTSQGRKAGDPEYESAINLKQEAQKRIDALAAFDKNTQVVTDHTEAVRELKKKVDEANAAATANTQTITDETAQRDSARSVLEEHQAAAKQQTAITKVERAGGVDAALAGGLGAIDAIEHGRRLDAKGQQAYQAFRAVFESVHGQFDRIIAIDEKNASLHQSHDQRLANLEVMYNNLKTLATRPST